MAERTGFEPAEVSLSGFQDQRVKPLRHTVIWTLKKEQGVLAQFVFGAPDTTILQIPSAPEERD